VQVITVANQKGGTAKTTTAAAIAQAGAAQGLKVLAIDIDPQGNLSFMLKADARGGGCFELLEGTPARRLIQETAQGIDTIPASRNLATISTATGSAQRLQRALQPIRGIYDLIVIDTPPTAGELLYNALQASTGLLIPLQADVFGLQGLYQIADTARQFGRSNPALTVKGFVLTRYSDRSTLAKSMKATITKKAAEIGIPCLAEIREGVAIREAAALQRSLFEYAPKSKPAQDYKNLFTKIMEG
jgi:chromosome partitioning protein